MLKVCLSWWIEAFSASYDRQHQTSFWKEADRSQLVTLFFLSFLFSFLHSLINWISHSLCRYLSLCLSLFPCFTIYCSTIFQDGRGDKASRHSQGQSNHWHDRFPGIHPWQKPGEVRIGFHLTITRLTFDKNQVNIWQKQLWKTMLYQK